MSEETPLLDESINDAKMLEQAANAARINFIEKSTEVKENPTSRLRLTKRGKAAVGLLTASASVVVGATVGPTIVERLDGIDYPAETTTHTVESGDDWYKIAESIPGIESVNKLDVISHIKSDPANIDAVDEGLRPGQTITIPIEVKP